MSSLFIWPQSVFSSGLPPTSRSFRLLIPDVARVAGASRGFRSRTHLELRNSTFTNHGMRVETHNSRNVARRMAEDTMVCKNQRTRKQTTLVCKHFHAELGWAGLAKLHVFSSCCKATYQRRGSCSLSRHRVTLDWQVSNRVPSRPPP